MKLYPRQLDVINAVKKLGKNACNYRVAELAKMKTPNSKLFLNILTERGFLKAEKIGASTFYKVKKRWKLK